MTLNLPTALTWGRILLIPLFIGVYYIPQEWLGLQDKNTIATALFLLGAITDWLDGYLARTLGQTSAFGAFLDPVADKLMVAAALILLVWLARVDAWIALVIIGREITISALREWMAKLGQSRSVAVSMVGKFKTAAQMSAIPLLLYDGPIFGLPTRLPGMVLMLLAAVLTVWSMLYYLRRAAPVLKGQ